MNGKSRLTAVLLLSAILILTMSITAMAGKAKFETKNNRFEIKLSKQEVKQTTKTAKKLAHGIDLWHDANLKSDNTLIGKYEKQIQEIINSDLQHSYKLVTRFEVEVNRSAGTFDDKNSGRASRVDDRNDLKSDVKDLKKAREMAKVKEKLYYAITHSDSFSNQYRLLNDYIDLLGRELGLNRVELAEDLGEWEEE
ncbi:MAG: hypothetical protein P1R58_11710 [bacterium]|nr:hypothetical protein [bacterium]